VSKSKIKKTTTKGRSRSTRKAEKSTDLTPVPQRARAKGGPAIEEELFGSLGEIDQPNVVTDDPPTFNFELSDKSTPRDERPKRSASTSRRSEPNENPRERRGRSNSTISPVLFEEEFTTIAVAEPRAQGLDTAPLDISTSENTDAQVSLLTNFWVDLDHEEANKEEDRFNEFFEDSVQNNKILTRDQEDSVSKRMQVGLYPSDAQLLEELFTQSKAAGRKNVSRARILRVALRHFHTCWLNADQSS
jgi:hypothetical protein